MCEGKAEWQPYVCSIGISPKVKCFVYQARSMETVLSTPVLSWVTCSCWYGNVWL